MEKIKIFKTIIKPFIGRGIGYKSSFLRNLFYRQFSRLAVRFLSPITIPGGNKLHLLPNGIDYLIGPYEEFTIELMRKNLKPGDTFLDLGAGIGYHTVIISKIIGDKGRVISFEPDPNYFKLLQKNAKENGCNNITLFQKAVSNRNGKTKLFLYDKVGRNRIGDINYLLSGLEVRDVIEVESVKLDDFMKEEKADFIKMDIEGSEYLALDGMKSFIQKNPKVKIIAEFSNYKTLEFLRLLKKLEFKIYEIKRNTKELNPIENFEEFIKTRFEEIDDSKREIGDLFCEKESINQNN